MNRVSMNMLKYIYAKNDFKYYDAMCIAENVEDNLVDGDDILVKNMNSSEFNVITLDEYYYVPKVAVLSRYKIDTDKNKVKQRGVIQTYRNFINRKVIMQCV